MTTAPARTEVKTCACGPTRRCYLCRPEMFQAYLKWQAYFARGADRALGDRIDFQVPCNCRLCQVRRGGLTGAENDNGL
jgi:hypothetical protein